MLLYSRRELNFESFTQNGSYGNQPQPSEVVFYSIDASTSCSFTNEHFKLKKVRKGQRTNEKYRNLVGSDEKLQKLEKTELRKADRTVALHTAGAREI